MKQAWNRLPARLRRVISVTLKGALTVGAFYLLLTHRIDDGSGGKISIGSAIASHLETLKWADFLPWVFAAAGIKFIGILCSMYRWFLLLRGQGIRFNFGHIFGSFLIGRFLGTFLPSTVGLDSYKLFDAAKFSGRVVEPAAATAVEKVMGVSGIFLTFLVTLPLGYPLLWDVFGDNAGLVLALTVGISVSVVGGLFGFLLRPGLAVWALKMVPAFGRGKIEGFITRLTTASTAYRGKGTLLVRVAGLSFLVHFTTAAMYYFTALAVGAHGADFWQVTFASSMQIFATVVSPLTIGGEGIREFAQLKLLQGHMGASQAVLSAALGFWAAEALTLVGAFFWWGRRADYKPKVLEVSEDLPPLDPQQADSSAPKITAAVAEA